MRTHNPDSARPEFAELDTIAVGRGPIADIAAGTGTVVVTNYGDNTVTVIDADNLKTAATVDVEGEPFAAVIADNRVYVSAAAPSFDSVQVIDTVAGAVAAGYPLGIDVVAGAVAVDGKRIFAGRAGRDGVDLAIIDTATDEQLSTIEIARGAGISVDAVRVSPNGQRIYVATTHTLGGNLVVVDPDAGRVVATVPIGAPIRDVALSPDGDVAYVLACNPRHGGVVRVVDTATHGVDANLRIGGFPSQMSLSPDGARAFVVDRDRVVVICTVTHETDDVLTVGAQPSSAAVSPDGGRLYVADCAGVVTVFAIALAHELPRFQVMATDVMGVPKARELQSAGV
jgi:YVTN family beta-propeller protein